MEAAIPLRLEKARFHRPLIKLTRETMTIISNDNIVNANTRMIINRFIFLNNKPDIDIKNKGDAEHNKIFSDQRSEIGFIPFEVIESLFVLVILDRTMSLVNAPYKLHPSPFCVPG